MFWSWGLAVIGVFGLYLTTRKMAAGYAVGLGVQVLWIAYAITTAQYGFIFSAIAFGAVNTIGYVKWTTEKKQRPDLKRIDFDKPGPVIPEEPTQQCMSIAFMPPSEYDARGMPEWNVYPYVRQHGPKVIIGPSTQKQYILSSSEAYHAGRALIEASTSTEHYITKSRDEA